MKTTIVGYLDAIAHVLTVLAALPYTLGDAATFIPAEHKATIAIAGLVAGTILKCLKGHVSQDSKTTKTSL